MFNRTFHPDEANQAFTTGRLLETGTYTYQPSDHHGPTLYYAAAPLQRAFGRTSTASLDGTLLRVTPLLFAVLALVWTFLALKRLTRSALAALAGAVLLAASPLFVFFATDFIQEMLLASFTALMLFTATRWLAPDAARPARLKPGTWALLFGAAAGLAFATKETSLITFGAAALAAIPFVKFLRARVTPSHLVFAAGGFLITSVVLYSSFGQDFSGVRAAFVAAPLHYLGRAAGDAAASAGADWHLHPVKQYLVWLFGCPPFTHCGAVLLLALLVPVCFLKKYRTLHDPVLTRAFLFLALHTLLVTLIYSLIPYKTPWCALQILLPLTLLAVLAFALAGDLLRVRVSLPPGILALALALLVAGVEHAPALRAMFRDPDSKQIPYNYANASPEVKDLAACIASACAARSPDTHPLVAVALPPEDTWPLPWYNRPLNSNTGYWTSFADLETLATNNILPAVVVTPMTEGHRVFPLFPHLKHTKRFHLRPRLRLRVFW